MSGLNVVSPAQVVNPVTEQQLENLTDLEQTDLEDDSYLQQLSAFKVNPLNLNEASATELNELRILTDLQINNLLIYRKLFGSLVSVYELQAVPTWDVFTIKKLLPYISVSVPVILKETFENRITKGQHSLLMRVSEVLEKSKGYYPSTTGNNYAGGRQHYLMRYRYQYKNEMSWGITTDKDAGEPFLKQRKGFDFYSFHLSIKKVGIIQSLVVGDFTVNMGQGLIQWQSLAFKKSADVLAIKRQSAVIKPYTSAAEFYFNRGIGATIQLKKIELTAFASIRNNSANFSTDTLNEQEYVTSVLLSGYHRTQNEMDGKNKLRQASFGSNISYNNNNWHAGFNAVFYHFNHAINKRDEPYNLFSWQGNDWHNYSVDYSYTKKNFHLFGEAAIDKNRHSAIVNGLLISVDPRVDLSFLQRSISKEYQAVYGNAFTENTFPTNEKGFFAGISLKPSVLFTVDAYADVFIFPWLKYLVDAPSSGKEFLVQLTFNPNKQTEIYSRFKTESKQANQKENTTVTNFLQPITKQSWRTQFFFKINNTISIRNRVELVWYNKKKSDSEEGFLAYFDLFYKPVLKNYSANMRLAYFQTQGYNSRLYAYENDVLYSFSIPPFFGKGFRYYLNLDYNIRPNVELWLRWAQTIYEDQQTIGSGLDQINGNKKSEIKLQLLWEFKSHH